MKKPIEPPANHSCKCGCEVCKRYWEWMEQQGELDDYFIPDTITDEYERDLDTSVKYESY